MNGQFLTCRNRPHVSTETKDAVVSLLLPLLRTIGDHRNAQTRPSKGRGRKKRSTGKSQPEGVPARDDNVEAMQQHLKVGFNSVMRTLEEQVQSAGLQTNPSSKHSNNVPDSLAMILVCRSSLPPPTCNSLPLLVAAASRANAESDAIRLLEMTDSSQSAVAAAMGLPRVGMLGIMSEMPDARPLIQYVRDTVESITAPWAREAVSPIYLPTKIDAVKTHVGAKEQSKKRKEAPS